MLKRFQFLVIVFIASSSSVFSFEEGFYSLKTRANAMQPFWLIEPESPVASVILFAGGKGKLKIDAGGIGKTGNFLVRTRELFAKAGFTVAVVDKPTDQADMYFFRTSEEHDQDIQAVVTYLSNRNAKPIWLVGTSRGTISVANIASRLNHSAVKGIVLTSSVMRPSNNRNQSLKDVAVEAIKLPVLFVHHENDKCYVCPYEDAPEMMKAFTQATKVELKSFSGGWEKQSNGCKAKTHHGFLGIEEKVVKTIASWINSN